MWKKRYIKSECKVRNSKGVATYGHREDCRKKCYQAPGGRARGGGGREVGIKSSVLDIKLKMLNKHPKKSGGLNSRSLEELRQEV